MRTGPFLLVFAIAISGLVILRPCPSSLPPQWIGFPRNQSINASMAAFSALPLGEPLSNFAQPVMAEVLTLIFSVASLSSVP